MVHILKVTLTWTTKEQWLLASNLTKLDIGPNICAFVQRIRLMTLTTVLGSTYQITQLLQNIDGSYVQFPYLHEFKLENWSSDGHDQWAPGGFDQWSMEEILPQSLPVFPGAIPFPSLRNLSISGSFFFGDDTPFRGNKDTLECLYLCISSGMLRVLKERQVFTHNSHPKLQCVRFGLSSFRPLDHIDSEISRMTSVLNIGSNAS
ncbi:hypothetical protein GGI13_003209, partial [Coemansia sp. RSA 455]